MNNATKSKYVLKFEDKHKVKGSYVSTSVLKFSDGRHHDINDIAFDIDNNIEVGQIENYSDIGTDSAISVPFKTWYELKHK